MYILPLLLHKVGSGPQLQASRIVGRLHILGHSFFRTPSLRFEAYDGANGWLGVCGNARRCCEAWLHTTLGTSITWEYTRVVCIECRCSRYIYKSSTYTYVYVYLYMYIYIYVCMYVYMYISVYM